VNAVVYRNTANHIIEISLAGGWVSKDLTPPSKPAIGDPAAYVRADGKSAIVYRTTGNHIIELTPSGTSWASADLTAQSGSAPLAASDPSAFARSDGYSSVVYRGSDNLIYEMYLPNGGSWTHGSPFGFVPPWTPAAASKPFGFVWRDGTNAIVYRSSANELWELYLDKTAGWLSRNLSAYSGVAAVTGNPTAYVRSDNYTAYLYRNTSGHIIEIASNGVTFPAGDLTSFGGALSSGDPSPYIRLGGTNAVVFRSSDNHVNALELTGGTWHPRDLTQESGETP